MFRPAALLIGLRYTRAKRRNHFISLISLVSLIGIALGVTVLITVLSVMNGFDREIQKRVFSIIPAMTVTGANGFMSDWQGVDQDLKRFTFVKATSPFVVAQVLLNLGSAVQPALLTGVIPAKEENITEIGQKMVAGQLKDLKPGQFKIVLGEILANELGARIGDKITVITPQMSLTPAGVMPRFKRFTVVGIFKAGNGFGFDRGMGFIHLTDSQKLLGLGTTISGLHLNIENVYLAPKLVNRIATGLDSPALITTWADQFGEFFHAIQLEKTMMFIILLLIIAVAAFNLVSTLMMVVSEKESDIAILRTLGATPRLIMGIFILQGGLIGVSGTLFGIIGGVLLAKNVTAIVNGIEYLFNVQFLSSNVYFVNYLPSYIEWSDIAKIAFVSLGLSLFATIYPAFRAAKTDPVESLRHE